MLWFWHFSILLFLGFLTHICSRYIVKSVEKRPSKKSGLWYFLPYIYIHKKKFRVLLWFWHFSILLFLGFLTHTCSRNMVKSVEKRPSKKSGYFLPYIYIHKKNSTIWHCPILWLSTSLNLIRLIFMWTIIQESCRFTEKNFSHYCFSLLLHPAPMGVGWRAISAPTDTFLVF